VSDPVAPVQRWWAEHPMTYGDVHGEATAERGTPTFFASVDRRFLEWNRPLHGRRPFERIFPYDHYRGARVLEVGCGMGTMASIWAREGALVTAVDLNPTAAEQTRRRFELLGLEGEILQADGRELPFESGAFDYCWSWGVLHHSPDLKRSLSELLRVVRPGGGYGVMVYHRRSLLHAYMTRYVEGFLHLERRFLTDRELASRYGDAAREEGNPYTWPVTRSELRAMLDAAGGRGHIRVLGTDLDSGVRLMLPGLGDLVPTALKKPWARRLGWSLWAHGQRR
jgi:ubiquinone/menaquinone biosynthesis C-methylase UbiE